MTKTCKRCNKRKNVSNFRVLQSGRLYSYCHPCANEYRKEYEQREARKVKDRMLRNKYGITIEQYEDMLEAQGGVCAICGKTCPTGKMLAVDHDEETGVVRGLLCSPCNTGIGQLQHSVDLLTAAMSYLIRANEEITQNETAVANV